MYLNKKSTALIHYKNKIFLNPIQNVRNELLAPIIYNQYTLELIEDIQYILSRFSDSNFVKLWLFSKLKEDKIIINAKINEGTGELFYKIKNIKSITIDQISMEDITDIYLPSVTIYRRLNIIQEDDLNCKPIFEFNSNGLDSILKDNKLNQLYCGCYIITFKNKLYYYIGSSINLKNRINTHIHNLTNYIKALKAKDDKAKDGKAKIGNLIEWHIQAMEAKNDKIKKSEKLNEILKFYLDSIVFFSGSTESLIQRAKLKNNSVEQQILYELGFDIRILYLNTNYLNLFKRIYPDYNLCKGELILLTKITDFITRTLEYSLIKNFHPKLNVTYKPIYKHFEWNDEFLDNYSRNKILSNYPNNKKYAIYMYFDKTEYPDYLLWNSKELKYLYDIFPLEINYEYDEKLICISTLQNICSTYNLREYEILGNLNQYHNYKETLLKNPLKIIEVNPMEQATIK